MDQSPGKMCAVLAALYAICAGLAVWRPYTDDYGPMTFASEFGVLLLMDSLYNKCHISLEPGHPALAPRSLIIYCLLSALGQAWGNSTYDRIAQILKVFLLVFSAISAVVDQFLVLGLLRSKGYQIKLI